MTSKQEDEDDSISNSNSTEDPESLSAVAESGGDQSADNITTSTVDKGCDSNNGDDVEALKEPFRTTAMIDAILDSHASTSVAAEKEASKQRLPPQKEKSNLETKSGQQLERDEKNSDGKEIEKEKSNLESTSEPFRTTAMIDAILDSHASTSVAAEKEASKQRLPPQKEKSNLETTSGQQVEHDEKNSDGKDKEIDLVDSMEGGKMKPKSPINAEEQESPQRNKFNYNSDEKLVIATAVPFDDEELLRENEKLDIKQVATEYEPIDEQNKSLWRRHPMIVGGCVVLGVALIVLLAVLLSTRKNECSDADPLCQTDTLLETMAPSSSPTEITRESMVVDFLKGRLPPEVFAEGTSFSMALDWILFEDRRHLDVNTNDYFKTLLQRYALAVFYFSSTRNGSAPWRSCNPPFLRFSEEPLSTTETYNSTSENNSTCTFLERGRSGSSIVYNEIPGRNRWLSSLDECLWQGVNCISESKVATIDVTGQGIQGNLDDASNVFPQAFPALRQLLLSYNSLTGTLPAALASFFNLVALDLHGNSLSGEIPQEYFDKLTTLQRLNVGENILSGSLDTKIGQLTRLQGLHLHQNNFRGQLPSEIGKLTSLNNNRIDGNEFSGTLPTEIGRLSDLVEFQYSDNLFVGTIPPEFGQLTSIAIFRLDGNQLSGTIPVELCNMTNSQLILLDRNALSGPLPTIELLQLQQLFRFHVNNNRLTGPIPSQLGELPRLRLAWLHLNQFTGSMPIEVCEAASVPNTGLNFLQADCAPIDNPPNPCRCCSACCDRSTEVCTAA